MKNELFYTVTVTWDDGFHTTTHPKFYMYHSLEEENYITGQHIIEREFQAHNCMKPYLMKYEFMDIADIRVYNEGNYYEMTYYVKS